MNLGYPQGNPYFDDNKNKVQWIIFKRFYLFIFREEKGGRKRGRETSMCGCLSHAPYWTWQTIWACARTGNEAGDPLVFRPALNQWLFLSGSSKVTELGLELYTATSSFCSKIKTIYIFTFFFLCPNPPSGKNLLTRLKVLKSASGGTLLVPFLSWYRSGTELK